MSNYARQSDLDKLAVQVEKFVENMNKLLITKELHEAAQNSIFEKLSKIESLIEKSQENVEKTHQSIEERVKILENNSLRQKTFRRIVYAQGAAVFALSSQHWSKIANILLKLFS